MPLLIEVPGTNMHAFTLGKVLHEDASIGLEAREIDKSMGQLLVKRYSCDRYEEADCLLKEALRQMSNKYPVWAVLKEVILSDGAAAGLFAVNFIYEQLQLEILSNLLKKNDRTRSRSSGMSRYQLAEVIYEKNETKVQVCAAYDTEANIPVIAKIFGPYAGLTKGNDVIREALMQATMAHINITKATDIWLLGYAKVFKIGFALERLSTDLKRDIAARKGQQRPYTEAELVTFLRQVTSALMYLRGRGIAHRDIKPNNIFLDNIGQFKIGDFGSASIVRKVMKGRLSDKGEQANKVDGSLLYLSPELRSWMLGNVENIDSFAGDIYSLGVTVLEMASLDDPISLNTIDMAALQQAIRSAVSSLSYSENFKLIIREMLIFDYNNRPRAGEIFFKITNLLEIKSSQDPTIMHSAEDEAQVIEAYASIEALHERMEINTYYDMFHIEEMENNYEAAAEWLEKYLNAIHVACGKMPDIFRCYLTKLGNLYSHLGQFQKSMHFYLKDLSIMQNVLPRNHPDLAASFDNLGNVCIYLGQMKEAEEYYLKSLQIQEILYAKNHPSVSLTLNDLGYLYFQLDRIQEAEKYNLESFRIMENTLSGNHPGLASCMGNLGMIYYQQGHFKEAEEFLSKCLIIREERYPEFHPVIAATCCNLGNLYSDLGRMQEAKKLYLRSLSIMQMILAENHPDLALIYFNLGSLYSDLGQIEKALKYHSKSLRIREIIFSENHPAIAASLNNLGTIYYKQNQIQKAKRYFARSLNIRKTAYQKNHLSIAESFTNLGNVYLKLCKMQKAEECYFESLKIKKAKYSENHPEIAMVYTNLGYLYHQKGQAQEAEKYLLKSLSIMQKGWPENHPDIAGCCNNLGNLYIDLDRMQEAEEYLLKSCKIKERIYEETHPELGEYYNNLGKLNYKLGRVREAKIYYLKYLKIMRKNSHVNERGFASACNNVGLCYIKEGQAEEAEMYFLKSLRVRDVLYQENHPETAAEIAESLSNLGTLYFDLGRLIEAEKYYLSAHKIIETIYDENHPEVEESYNNLGNVYHCLGQVQKAEEYYKRCHYIINP